MSAKSADGALRLSFLDRLIDRGTPGRDGGASRVSAGELKQTIVRDLSWLLNANSLEQTVDLRAYPHVADSTLNYGAPALDGQHRDGLDMYRLQEGIAHALRRFETRFIPGSVHVTGTSAGGAISIRIEAEIQFEPLPLRIVMRTEVDPEMPVIRIVECRDEGYE